MLKSEIPTPALLLDLRAMESNLKKMAAFFGEGPTRLRPHYKNHKCVALAKRQMGRCDRDDLCDAGRGRPWWSGIQNILLADEIAGTAKVERFAELSREADLMVAVDNGSNISALSAASTHMNVPLSVLVDVDTGMGLCGAPPGEPALALAQMAHAEGLRFRGLTG